LKKAMNAADQKAGWNWTYWANVLRPLLLELTDADHAPALVAPLSTFAVGASAPDVALSARQSGGSLYLVAVRKSPTLSGEVRFTGLPTDVREGLVLAHPNNPARQLTVAGGAFTDPSPFAPHDARVYRFAVPPAGAASR
jgi:hypothetical protein